MILKRNIFFILLLSSLAAGKADACSASLSGLLDYQASLISGVDGNAGATYEASSTFEVQSTCNATVSVSSQPLVNGSDESQTISTLVHKIDGLTALSVQAGHDSEHTITTTISLPTISSQRAGSYSTNIIVTITAD